MISIYLFIYLPSLRYKFLPHKYYKQDFGVTPSQVLAYLENKFFIKAGRSQNKLTMMC